MIEIICQKTGRFYAITGKLEEINKSGKKILKACYHQILISLIIDAGVGSVEMC